MEYILRGFNGLKTQTIDGTEVLKVEKLQEGGMVIQIGMYMRTWL